LVHRSIFWALFLCVALPSPALGEGVDRSVVLDRIVAFVEDEILTLHDLDRAVMTNRTMGRTLAQEGGATPEELRKTALSALIDEKLVLGEAHRLNLKISPQDIDKHLDRTREQNGWDDAALKFNVERLGFSMEEYRKILMNEQLKARVVSIRVGSRVHVSDADVARVLARDHGGGTEQDEVRARIIVRRIPMGASSDELAEIRRFTQWVRAQVEAAPELFDDLARKYSEHDPTRVHGGDLGYFTRGTFADETLDTAAFTLSVMGVSEILETRLGFQLVQVTDRRKAPIDDVEALKQSISEAIHIERRTQLYRQWLEELRQSAWLDIRL